MIVNRWLALSVLTLLLGTAGGRVDGQQAPSLAVDPPTRTVALEDGPFEVPITIDDITTGQGLGGYTLVMTYDPAVLHARTVTDSGFVASTGNAVVCPAGAIDNDAGRLAHFCFTIPIFGQPGPQTNQPQALATIRFEPIGEGITTLDISETMITDPRGNMLAATTVNGAVTVERRPTGAGPSPTPPTEPLETSPAENETGDTSLPASGSGPDGGTDRGGLYVALLFAGIGGIVGLGAVLLMRMSNRAA